MSDEKRKPFAQVVSVSHRGGSREFFGVEAAGTPMHWPDDRREIAESAADRINAAVEQREAKLREVLRRVEWRGAGVDEPYTCCPVCLVENEFHPSNQKPHRPDCALAAALAGTGPDYVPRAELDAEQAKVKAMQAALDLLGDEGHESMRRSEVRAYLEASGLKKPHQPTFAKGWQEGVRVAARWIREHPFTGDNAHERYERCLLGLYGMVEPSSIKPGGYDSRVLDPDGLKPPTHGQGESPISIWATHAVTPDGRTFCGFDLSQPLADFQQRAIERHNFSRAVPGDMTDSVTCIECQGRTGPRDLSPPAPRSRRSRAARR